MSQLGEAFEEIGPVARDLDTVHSQLEGIHVSTLVI